VIEEGGAAGKEKEEQGKRQGRGEKGENGRKQR